MKLEGITGLLLHSPKAQLIHPPSHIPLHAPLSRLTNNLRDTLRLLVLAILLKIPAGRTIKEIPRRNGHRETMIESLIGPLSRL